MGFENTQKINFHFAFTLNITAIFASFFIKYLITVFT